MDEVDDREELGCLSVPLVALLLVVVMCLGSALVERAMTPTPDAVMRACAESCGPGRMLRYHRFDGCVCVDEIERGGAR
ncbi:MAG: hypothetical protein ACRCSL_16690 [Microbacterium sp.]